MPTPCDHITKRRIRHEQIPEESTRTVSSNNGRTPGQSLVTVDKDDASRLDCFIDESTGQGKVYKEVRVIHVFNSNPRMGESRLRVFCRDLILTY